MMAVILRHGKHNSLPNLPIRKVLALMQALILLLAREDCHCFLWHCHAHHAASLALRMKAKLTNKENAGTHASLNSTASYSQEEA